MKIYHLLLITFCLLYNNVNAQHASDATPQEHLEMLREGAIVLVIQSHQKKKEELNKMISRIADTTSSSYRYYTKELRAIDTFISHQVLFQRIFTDELNHNQVLIMWDHDLHKLMNDDLSDIFLDENLNLLKNSIEVETPIYTLKNSVSNSTQGFGYEAWLLRTRYLEKIGKPFPYSIRVKPRFFSGIYAFFGIKDSREQIVKRAKKLAQKLNLVLSDQD